MADFNETVQAPEVIICDDHVAIRAGLYAMLEQEGLRVVAECDNARELFELAQSWPRAVVVTDLGVNELSFPMFMSGLRAQSPYSPVVVYSMRESPAVAELCYQTGAAAFIPKSAHFDEVAKAIQAAAQGKTYFASALMQDLIAFKLDKRSPGARLSAKEIELLVQYASGRSVQDLAVRFGLSEKTVQNRLTHLTKVLGVPRAALHVVAREYGLLEI